MEGVSLISVGQFKLIRSVRADFATRLGVMAHGLLQVERSSAGSLGDALPRHCRAVISYSLEGAKTGGIFSSDQNQVRWLGRAGNVRDGEQRMFATGGRLR